MADTQLPKAPSAAAAAARPPGAEGLHNEEIAAALAEMADLLEIESANPFRVRAYRNAARIVAVLPEDVAGALQRGGTLDGMPGIGADLGGKIEQLARTGSTPLLRQLRGEVPPTLADLLRLPGLGPRRVQRLHQALGIATADELRSALREGRLAGLAGFGKKVEARLLEAVEAQGRAGARTMRFIALQSAEPLAAWLRALPRVEAVSVAGSCRRACDTVGDIDLVAASPDPAALIARFGGYREIDRVLASGPTRATALLRSGLQVDPRAVPPEGYGAALAYFTGSKAHTIAIRRLAREQGLKINEYGVFRGKTRIGGRTEDQIYAALGLPTIAPELREDQGEIEAARAGKLPRLVELADIRGDLHVHSVTADGRSRLAGIVAAARARGYAYVAVTDRVGPQAQAGGFDPIRLRRQMEEIDEINRAQSAIRVLKGVEVEIAADGSLALPDDVLAELDLVVAAVHDGFDLEREAQTRRVLRALDHPLVTILAHPGGRLIGKRAAMDVDMDRVMLKAKTRGRILELDAQPDRLDLTDIQGRRAKALGIAVSVSSDARSAAELDLMSYGIGQARRGWLERSNIFNTLHGLKLCRRLAEMRAQR